MDSRFILNQHCPDLNICLCLPFLSNFFNVSNVASMPLTHVIWFSKCHHSNWILRKGGVEVLFFYSLSHHYQRHHIFLAFICLTRTWAELWAEIYSMLSVLCREVCENLMSLLYKRGKDSCIHSWKWIVLLVGYNAIDRSLAFGKAKAHWIAVPTAYTGSIKTHWNLHKNSQILF